MRRLVSYPDACRCRLAVLAELGVGAIQSLDLDLVLTNVRLELLALPAELCLVLGFNLGDRSLQLVDSPLSALPTHAARTPLLRLN